MSQVDCWAVVRLPLSPPPLPHYVPPCVPLLRHHALLIPTPLPVSGGLLGGGHPSVRAAHRHAPLSQQGSSGCHIGHPFQGARISEMAQICKIYELHQSSLIQGAMYALA